jgi:signal transduction histidine kinase
MTNKIFKKFSAFEWAAVKLSVFYVLIAMTISISFSILLFNISKDELGRGLGKTFKIINQCSLQKLPPGFEDLEHARVEQINEVNDNLQLKLIYFNLAILILSWALSYFLARKTLHPLEEAMDSQKRFTADASHELRTPLAAMRVEIEVALRDKNLSKEEARALLNSNIEEISKLENLSDALLKLARYQHNGFEFSKLDISNIVVEAYEKIEKLAKAKNIEFKNEIISADVSGEKGSLVELFVILLDNAVKYSDKDSKIEINIVKVQNQVLVKIKDHGDGIKASDFPHIFDRFYRADSSRAKTKIDGYGLGLSLAKQIVSLHGGEISAKSTLGKGSEFTVILPS